MPVFESITQLDCSPESAFDFISRPANLALVMPPEMNIKLIDPPERVALGCRIKGKASRFGIQQTIVTEVTEFEDGVGFVDEQVEGPFAKMVHTHRVEPHDGGTQLTDRIEFEAPGGALGWILTEDRILRELKTLAAFRSAKYQEHLHR